MNKVLLEPRFLDIVLAILKAHVPDNEAWVFGSRAGGVPKPHSDLDLAIVDPPKLSQALLAHLKHAFEESDLPIRVDVLVLSELEPSFRERVMRSHVRVA